MQVLQQPFFQIALPIMATMLLTGWTLISSNNKAFDAMQRRLDDICRRLDAIEARLGGLETRVGALERKVDALEIKAWR